MYTGDTGWITRAEAATEAETTKRLLQAAGIQAEITESENTVKQWMLRTTSDGAVNVLILYGVIPTTLYPPENTLPDGSVAENWIETRDGNTILNHADYFGFRGTGDIFNGVDMLQNLMDIPNITLAPETPPFDNIPMFVTTDGSVLTPSLVNFQSDRPFPLHQFRGDRLLKRFSPATRGMRRQPWQIRSSSGTGIAAGLGLSIRRLLKITRKVKLPQK